MPTPVFLRSIDVSGVGSGVVGPGWAGLSGTTAVWGTTTSGTPKRWADYLFGGTNNRHNGLLRTGEPFQNGKARLRALATEVNVGIMARAIGSVSGGSWWSIVFSNTNMDVTGRVAGSNVLTQSRSSIPGLPSQRLIEVAINNNSATQTTITVKLWDGTLVPDMSVATISASPIFDESFLFTTTGYDATLRASGAWGMAADNGVDYGEWYHLEDAVALAATASLGSVFRESFYATVSPTGGVSTNTITAHLSTVSGFTPSGANEISGLSGTTLSASGLTPGKIYYLKFKVVNGAETVITDQITVTTKPSNHYVIVARGDSLTDGTGATLSADAPVPKLVSLLEAQNYSVTGLEEGVFGDSTAGSLSSISGLITRSAFAKADELLVMLGTNDPGQGISAATSQSNLINIIDQMAAGVPTLRGIMLNQQPFANDRNVAPYVATHSAVIAGTTTTKDYLGNQTMFAYGQANYPGIYADQVHLNTTGYAYMANLWANTFMGLYSPTYGLSPLVLSASTLQVEVGGSRPMTVRVVSSLDGTGQAGVVVTASSNNAGVTISASATTDADGYAQFRGSAAVVVPATTSAGTTANITFGYSTLTAVCAVTVVAAGGLSGGSGTLFSEGEDDMAMAYREIPYTPSDTTLVTDVLAARRQGGFYTLEDATLVVEDLDGGRMTLELTAGRVKRVYVKKILETGSDAVTVYLRDERSFP